MVEDLIQMKADGSVIKFELSCPRLLCRLISITIWPVINHLILEPSKAFHVVQWNFDFSLRLQRGHFVGQKVFKKYKTQDTRVHTFDGQLKTSHKDFDSRDLHRFSFDSFFFCDNLGWRK